jgi:peptidoglycan hydrolase-like protein with peptidoglycan-binding domain
VTGKLPPYTVLRRGNSGSAVQVLQRALNAQYPLYSHLVTDGIFGPATESVVRQFQTRDHLAVDGIAGPITLRALFLI